MYGLFPCPIPRHHISIASFSFPEDAFWCIINVAIKIWIAYLIFHHYEQILKQTSYFSSIQIGATLSMVIRSRAILQKRKNVPSNISLLYQVNNQIKFFMIRYSRLVWIKRSKYIKKFVDLSHRHLFLNK